MPSSNSEPPMTPAAAEAAVPRNDPPEPKPGARISGERHLPRISRLRLLALRLIGARRAYARHRAARRVAAESLPHAVEETCRPLFRLRRGACLHLQFLDTCIGALERLVLQQHRLYQRVNGMRSAPQTVGDQALRLRIALCGFELDQTIEQFIDELGFLRGHSVSPCLRTALVM